MAGGSPTTSHDDRVMLWNAETGAEVAVLGTIAKQSGDGVAFSPDSTLLAASGAAGEVKVWSVPDGVLRHTLQDGTRSAEHLAWLPDGSGLAVVGADGVVKVWDVPAATERTRFAHGRGTLVTAVSTDGKTMAIGSSDRTISIWRVATGERLRVLSGHGEGISAVALSPDATRLSSVSSDGTLRVWDVATGASVLTVPSTDSVYGTAWSSDGRRVAMLVLNRTLRILEGTAAR